jgi:IS5 family transposase
MVTKTHAQMSFADGLVYKREGVNEVLDRVAAAIDWSAIERVLSPPRPRGPGAPGYPALVLFKAVLLAQWHGLSDEALEAMLGDRLSFQRFCGLGLSDPKPDHTTLWRFREHLSANNLATAAFAEIDRQLQARGLVLKQGTLIDATLLGAQAVAPPHPKNEPTPEADADSRPPSRLVRSTVDPDARWTRRGQTLFFGYKAHVAVDQGSGLIRAQLLTSAEVNETSVANELIQGDERAVYADKAYDTHARRARLKALGIKNRIQRRGNKHHAPTPRERLRNVLIGRVRGRVETVFAHFKRIFGYRRVRYFNAARNAVQLALLCTAYNLQKLARLAPT